MARLRASLAGSQVALATALLALSGLLIVSLANLARVDLGVERAGLSLFRIAPILNGYTPPRALALYAQIENALQQAPWRRRGERRHDPTPRRHQQLDQHDGDRLHRRPRRQHQRELHQRRLTLLLDLFGIPLVAGREFTDADTDATRPVAIGNEAFGRKFRLAPTPVRVRLGTI